MGSIGEDERLALSRLVAASIANLGMTEVSRVTGLSATALREYASEGIAPGVRAATLAALRRLEPGYDRPPSPDRLDRVEARLNRVEGQLTEMIRLLHDLDRRIQGMSPSGDAGV